jgi:peptidoglycan hydrolase-like protein with peptidoglycan-binding domain
MVPEQSVGCQGVNESGDVRLVQRLLNADLTRRGKPLLVVDGLVGPKTIGAITDYQKHYKLPFVDGRVDRDGPTIQDLIARSYRVLLRGFTPLARRRGVFLGAVDRAELDCGALAKYLKGLRGMTD